MTFEEYSTNACKTQLANSQSIDYLLLGLLGEAGELANKYKKVIRGDKQLSPEMLSDMQKELGDCLWYIDRLAEALGANLEVIAENNIVKLGLRKKNNTIMGDGDNR